MDFFLDFKDKILISTGDQILLFTKDIKKKKKKNHFDPFRFMVQLQTIKERLAGSHFPFHNIALTPLLAAVVGI